MKSGLVAILSFLTISICKSQPLCDFQGKDSLFTVVSGDTIYVWDIAACAYCSAAFRTRVTASTDSIYIVQTDTAGRIATCDCLFNLRTSIVGLTSGTYWIAIYRDLLKQYGYPFDLHQFIGSIQVNYQPSASPALSWNTSQSGCNPNFVRSGNDVEPRRFVLYQNYPNPFNPTTTVRFQTPKSSFVVIKLYDLLGREVQTLWAEQTPAGTHTMKLNVGENVASGTYFCRMDAESMSQTVIVVLLR